MQRLYFLLSILILASLPAGCAPKAVAQPEEVKALSPEKSKPADTAKSETVSKDSPASCPVTVPQEPPFIAPEPYSPNAPFPTQFWFGFEHLWTALPIDGIWAGLPLNADGYTQKVFWWREGYVWTDEPQPELIVKGERLDASAPPLNASKATNAYASDIGSAMLVGVDFPTLGCWKITGQYGDAELSFVAWIAP